MGPWRGLVLGYAISSSCYCEEGKWVPLLSLAALETSFTAQKSLIVNAHLFSTMYSCSQQCTALLTEIKQTTPTCTWLLQHDCYCYRHFQDCVIASCYSQQHSMCLNSLSMTAHAQLVHISLFFIDLMTPSSRKLSHIFYWINKQYSQRKKHELLQQPDIKIKLSFFKKQNYTGNY